MMKRILCSLIFAAALISSCEKNADSPDMPGKVLTLTAEESAKANISNRFSLNLFQTATANLRADQNAFLSPLSVSMALGMTANGARTETGEAMYQTLGLESADRDLLNSYFQKLITELPQLDPKVKLNIANSIWHRQGFNVIPAFSEMNRKYYQASVEALDFDDPAAPDRINDWVNAKTDGLIPAIVDQIPDNMVMYLINAIYFKGSWQQKFDVSKTTQKPFHLPSGGLLETDFMNVEHRFPNFKNEYCRAIELPYGDTIYSMVLLLPSLGTNPKELINRLNQENTWDTWSEQFRATEIDVWMPKFTFSYKNKLNDELKDMGMGIAFTDEADFSGITPDGRLLIDEVMHKSFIKVDEEGTEAAAATSVGIGFTSVGPNEMLIDRPFIFMIRENNTGLILFIGQVNDPSAEVNKAE